MPKLKKENEAVEKLVTLCRKQERIRKISRSSYAAVKEDIARVEQGKEPLKEFIHDNDFRYWRTIAYNTEKCIKSGGEEPVSIAFFCSRLYLGMFYESKRKVLGFIRKRYISRRIQTCQRIQQNYG